MKIKHAISTGALCLFVATLLVAPTTRANSIPTRGNSNYGVGDGSGSWNFGTTTLDLGGVTVEEQMICPTGSGAAPCPGDLTFAFQIQSPVTDFDFTLSGLESFTLDSGVGTATFGALLCDESSGNGPGAECTDSGNSVIPGIMWTNDGNSSVTFQVTGQGNGLTFFVTEAANGQTLDSPTAAFGTSGTMPAPEPASILLLGTGLFGLMLKKRARA